MSYLPNALRALRSKNYRLFFAAQNISLSGLWMQRVAMGWLVYRLTLSNSALGFIDFANSLPIFLFTAFAGAINERHDLRKVLAICQAGCTIIALTLTFLTLTNIVTYHAVLFLSLSLGFIDAFELPCRYALVSYMVDRKEDIPNAVALNSAAFNVARMIGPTIAGFVIHAVGEGICFLINGMAYSFTIGAVMLMKMDRPPIGNRGGEKRAPLRDTIEGFNIARNFAPTRNLLLMISITGFFAFPSLVLMPAMARSVLGGTSRTLGFLMTGVAIGALTGSFAMAARKSPTGLVYLSSRMCIAFGLSVAAFALSPNIFWGIILAMPVGFCMVACLIACNTLIQTMTAESAKSRIMSLYTLAVVGIPPLGSVLAGEVADVIGTDMALLICGVVCMASSYYFMKKLDRLKITATRALKRESSI